MLVLVVYLKQLSKQGPQDLLCPTVNYRRWINTCLSLVSPEDSGQVRYFTIAILGHLKQQCIARRNDRHPADGSATGRIDDAATWRMLLKQRRLLRSLPFLPLPVAVQPRSTATLTITTFSV